jgi:hypothetical protein
LPRCVLGSGHPGLPDDSLRPPGRAFVKERTVVGDRRPGQGAPASARLLTDFESDQEATAYDFTWQLLACSNINASRFQFPGETSTQEAPANDRYVVFEGLQRACCSSAVGGGPGSGV